MMNDLDRYRLVMDVIHRVPGLEDRAGHVRDHMQELRDRARAHTREWGEDSPEVRDWTWQASERPDPGPRRGA
jgi:xylulose-5-phosphate/fructose-6-phosphate phosphoketolase